MKKKIDELLEFLLWTLRVVIYIYYNFNTNNDF